MATKKRNEWESEETVKAYNNLTDMQRTPSQETLVYKQQLDKSDASKPGEYNSNYASQIQELQNKIANRKPFSYDVNSDALYNMYRDQYIRNGQLAMKNTMGQASALTGGYGNSYAAAAGNQAYQAELSKLNEIVPQLYQLAYDKYKDEGEADKDMLNMYQAQDEIDYGRYGDSYNRWASENNTAYGRYADSVNADETRFATDRGYYQDLYNQLYGQDYQNNRDAVADDQFNRNLAEQQRQYDSDIAYKYATLTEEQRQYNSDIAEKQRQYDANLAEERRQYDSDIAYKYEELKKKNSSGNSKNGSGGYNTGEYANDAIVKTKMPNGETVNLPKSVGDKGKDVKVMSVIAQATALNTNKTSNATKTASAINAIESAVKNGTISAYDEDAIIYLASYFNLKDSEVKYLDNFLTDYKTKYTAK